MQRQMPVASPDVEMRLTIMHAVDQPLDTISVKRICGNAGISRDTFYRYFESKFDIPLWHGQYVQQFYLNEIGRTIDWHTGYFHDFRMLAEEGEFYARAMPMVTSNIDGLPLMFDHRRKVILETLCDYRHCKVDEGLSFCLDAFVQIETELVAKWLVAGCKDPNPEVFAERMLSIVPPRLYTAMELPGV